MRDGQELCLEDASNLLRWFKDWSDPSLILVRLLSSTLTCIVVLRIVQMPRFSPIASLPEFGLGGWEHGRVGPNQSMVSRHKLNVKLHAITQGVLMRLAYTYYFSTRAFRSVEVRLTDHRVRRVLSGPVLHFEGPNAQYV